MQKRVALAVLIGSIFVQSSNATNALSEQAAHRVRQLISSLATKEALMLGCFTALAVALMYLPNTSATQSTATSLNGEEEKELWDEDVRTSLHKGVSRCSAESKADLDPTPAAVHAALERAHNYIDTKLKNDLFEALN